MVSAAGHWLAKELHPAAAANTMRPLLLDSHSSGASCCILTEGAAQGHGCSNNGTRRQVCCRLYAQPGSCSMVFVVAIVTRGQWDPVVVLLLPLLHLASGIPTVATDQPR
jgi:hypothetical protein